MFRNGNPYSFLAKAPQTQAATNWPKVMMRTLQLTSSPLLKRSQAILLLEALYKNMT